MQLAGVFGWDIDFALDIRAGDRFAVLYEERYIEGKKLGDGDILAAEFINNGRTFQAVKYTDPAGHSDYYSLDGRSMRKAFLRSPVDFRRISSRFRSERYHPVLGVKRPHRGVDYAAAIGTPIKAAGDGKIAFVGTKGGYGRTVIVQHGGTYSTLYGHLSRYNRSARVGARVRQGQVIGYVGKTGIATGPHLHYEFRVNGVHRNPLTVKLPNASPIGTAYKADFDSHASGMLARLAIIDQVQVAVSEP
jgi:murein DD-endopeptidase MepM/ murein hydrolase activator NlpD